MTWFFICSICGHLSHDDRLSSSFDDTAKAMPYNGLQKDGKQRLLMITYGLYAAAALAEIAGCFAFWAWMRMGKPVWWLAPGMVSLALFAWLLALVPSEAAGRTYAAYGGIYILASVLWLWLVEGRAPDRWDISGAMVCLAGASLILFAPRG